MSNQSAKIAGSDPLLEPLRIKQLVLKNRIMSTSHASGMDDMGMPAERYQRYHEEKAKGGLALTMFGESSNIAPDSPSVFDQLRVDNDKVIPHFQKFAECVHQHGNRLVAKLSNDLTNAEIEIITDQVIVESGTTPVDSLFHQLKDDSSNRGVSDIESLLHAKPQPWSDDGYELHRIGDAVSSRSLHAALLDAYRICVSI